MNLKHLTDKQLLLDTENLAKEDKKLTAKFLHYLKEIDTRKLYCEKGHSSLFNYVVQELGYSEASASRRINAARLLKDIPEIEEKIIRGDLTLSNVSKAAEKFKQEKIIDTDFKKEVLNSIENTSARTCQKTLSEIMNPNAFDIPAPRFHVSVELTEENYEIFEAIRNLLAHKKLSKDQIWEKVLTTAKEKIEYDRFKINTKAKAEYSNSRYVPAYVKKEVYLRDKACKKCGSHFALEFDHIKPYSLGGKTEISNLRLLCRNCNQRSRLSQKLMG